jgi:hypothetical protein
LYYKENFPKLDSVKLKERIKHDLVKKEVKEEILFSKMTPM